MKALLIMLNPFAPHITEEMYEILGFEGKVSEQQWVTYDENKCIDKSIEMAVQVNGKIKTKLQVAVDISKEDVIALAKADSKVANAIEGKTIVKEIVVHKKLVNIVVK